MEKCYREGVKIMNRSELKRLSQDEPDFNQFYLNFIEQTAPNRTIEKYDINRYVRIKAKTYGKDRIDQYNGSIPRTGQVVKINKKSIIIKADNELYKFPTDTLIYDITGYENLNMQDFENLYNEFRQ